MVAAVAAAGRSHRLRVADLLIGWASVAYGRLGAGRSHRSRVADLLIAAVAHADGRPLYTRNPGDFAGLDALVAVVAVRRDHALVAGAAGPYSSWCDPPPLGGG